MTAGLREVLAGLRTVLASGALRPPAPHRAVDMVRAVRVGGATPATLLAVSAARYPDRTAISDDRGRLSFADLAARVEALAAALRARHGVTEGSRVGVLCRNHRGFAEAFFAGARLGADVVPLNADFAAPQLRAVLELERVEILLYDSEFTAKVDEAGFTGGRVVVSGRGDAEVPTVDVLIAYGDPEAPRPRAAGAIVIMTSGTTGTPKGAPRQVGGGAGPLALAGLVLPGLRDLARFRPPPRSGGPIVVAPPLHHVFGLTALLAGIAYGSPIVLAERFDPEQTLTAVSRERAAVLCVVPTMLKRIMDLPRSVVDGQDTGSLRMIITGGSALPPALGSAVLDSFGDVLYNAYASTEVGPVSLATPADLRVAPGSVGRPHAFASLRILDDSGKPVEPGVVGRIFVRHPFLFAGYSGGGGKEVIDGHMSIGDVGHLDADGRLFVDGRDDDMVVSGGENVFPQEVEEVLLEHDAVADAGVVGVPDEEFGQRLTAAVVLKPGASVSEEALKAHVRDHLARYQVPREVVFVRELPRTTTGKLRRRHVLDVLDAP